MYVCMCVCVYDDDDNDYDYDDVCNHFFVVATCCNMHSCTRDRVARQNRAIKSQM